MFDISNLTEAKNKYKPLQTGKTQYLDQLMRELRPKKKLMRELKFLIPPKNTH